MRFHSFRLWLKRLIWPHNPWLPQVYQFQQKMGVVSYGTSGHKKLNGKILMVELGGGAVIVSANKKKYFISAPFSIEIPQKDMLNTAPEVNTVVINNEEAPDLDGKEI